MLLTDLEQRSGTDTSPHFNRAVSGGWLYEPFVQPGSGR